MFISKSSIRSYSIKIPTDWNATINHSADTLPVCNFFSYPKKKTA
jgi:hypothetical protein